MQKLLLKDKKTEEAVKDAFGKLLGHSVGVKQIINRWKKRLCPFCGEEGKKYMATNICKEHGEYWDIQYLEAIDLWMQGGKI